ncbi:MAG: cation transporting ATPase C-terminal domain-containing protein, partial [Oscillospiraceae bacterium]
LLGIAPSALLLLPLHIVLLELIIDPTCSLVLERQPAESDIMDRPPRNPKENIVNTGTLAKSIFQGLFIFAASFGTYFLTLDGNPENAPLARTMGLSIIMLSNLFLVQVNSSDHDFAFQSAVRLAKDKIMWAINLITLAGLCVILYTPLSTFLKLAPLPADRFFICLGVAAVSVLWYEIVKLIKMLKSRHSN